MSSYSSDDERDGWSFITEDRFTLLHAIGMWLLGGALRALCAFTIGTRAGWLLIIAGLVAAAVAVDLYAGEPQKRWALRAVWLSWLGAAVVVPVAPMGLPVIAVWHLPILFSPVIGWRSTGALLMPDRTKKRHQRRELEAAQAVTPKVASATGLHKDVALVNLSRDDRKETRVYLLPPVPGSTPNLTHLAEDTAKLYGMEPDKVKAHVPRAANLLHVDLLTWGPFEGPKPSWPDEDLWTPGAQPIGWNGDMDLRYLNLVHEGGQHLSIAGATGSGKSNTGHVVVAGRIVRRHLVRIVDAEKQGTEFGDWEDEDVRVAGSPADGMKMVLDTVDLMHARQARRKQLGHRFWQGRPLTLVVDEAGEFLKRAKMQDAIESLATLARTEGIMLVIITQNPTVELYTSTIKANVTNQIVHKVRDVNASNVALGAGSKGRASGGFDASDLPNIAGRAVADLVGHPRQIIQVFRAPERVPRSARNAGTPQFRAPADASPERSPGEGEPDPIAMVGKWAWPIIRALTDGAGPMTARELGDVVGASSGRAQETLKALFDLGLVEQVRARGPWRLRVG